MEDTEHCDNRKLMLPDAPPTVFIIPDDDDDDDNVTETIRTHRSE